MKTASQLEKPRYVIVAFQQKILVHKSCAEFYQYKHQAALNAIAYPYDDIKVDSNQPQNAVVHDMYTRF